MGLHALPAATDPRVGRREGAAVNAQEQQEPLPVGDAEAAASQVGPPGPRWKRVVKRVALGFAATVAVLAVVAALLYSFGGMERPAPEYRTAYDQLVAQGQATPVEVRFVIPIPGCRCHSSDPVAQVEHSTYRIKDCTRCH